MGKPVSEALPAVRSLKIAHATQLFTGEVAKFVHSALEILSRCEITQNNLYKQ